MAPRGVEADAVRSDGTIALDPPATVVIADPNPLWRDGLGRLLVASGLDVVGMAGTVAAARTLVAEMEPTLLITEVDLAASEPDGLDLALELRAARPTPAILVLSAVVDAGQAAQLLASGPGSGYLLKHRVSGVAGFVADVREVAEGGRVIDPALFVEAASWTREDPLLEVVSQREREVRALLAEGRSNDHIAARLWVTRDTVEKHVRSVFRKLGIVEDPDVHRRVVAALTYHGLASSSRVAGAGQARRARAPRLAAGTAGRGAMS